jgi:hypothetical protein
MGIAHLGALHGKSYSGPIRLSLEIMTKAVHCNGQHPSLEHGEHTTLWMMTCAPLAVPEDLKVLVREGLSKSAPRGKCRVNTRHSNYALL